MISLLQLSLWLDYLPSWLSVALVSSGYLIVLIAIISSGTDDTWVRRVGITGVGIGAIMYMYGAVKINLDPMMIGIILIAKYIEGLSLMRVFQKFQYSIRKRALPSTASKVTGIPTRLLYFFATVFFLVLAGWITVFAVVWGPIETNIGTGLLLYWTLATVVVTGVGLLVKFRGVEETGLASG